MMMMMKHVRYVGICISHLRGEELVQIWRL